MENYSLTLSWLSKKELFTAQHFFVEGTLIAISAVQVRGEASRVFCIHKQQRSGWMYTELARITKTK